MPTIVLNRTTCTNLTGYSVFDPYLIIHNRATADSISNNDENSYIDNSRDPEVAATDRIGRLGIIFDTSSIPANAIIDSAMISIYVKVITTYGEDHKIVLQNGQPTYPHNPIVTGDYYYLNYSGDGGSKNILDCIVDQYNDITIDSSWINKGGETKLMFRHSKDISSSAPTDYSYVILDGSEANPIKLTINYQSLKGWPTGKVLVK